MLVSGGPTCPRAVRTPGMVWQVSQPYRGIAARPSAGSPPVMADAFLYAWSVHATVWITTKDTRDTKKNTVPVRAVRSVFLVLCVLCVIRLSDSRSHAA